MIESRNDEWVNFTTNVEFQPFVETKHVKTLDIKRNQKEDLIVPKLSLPLNHYCMIAEKVCPSYISIFMSSFFSFLILFNILGIHFLSQIISRTLQFLI